MAQWEDLVGDTTELREATDAQTRRTMASMLRRPAQFGLPAWPRPVPAEEPPYSRGSGGDNLGSAGEADTSARGVGERSVPDRVRAEPAEAGDEPDAIYQLDMLTGELVPQTQVSRTPRTEPLTPRVRRPRQRKRPLPQNLAQLVLFPDEDLAS